MTSSILGIGTAVPATRLRQDDVRDLLAAQPGIDRRAQRLLGAAFDAASIDTRYSVLGELGGGASSGLGLDDGGPGLRVPSTGERNDEYRRVAPALFEAAARDALRRSSTAPDEVTHLITVSCTGMFAPGPDYRLVRDLGLSPATERYHLGFVGCAAAIPGLRAAHRIATAQPEAVVLVVCAELCSLHIRSSDDPEQIVAASIFADGAAAAVVSADPARQHGARLDLEGFGTRLADEGEHDMVWVIGDEGFEMTLTAEVPRIVGRTIEAVAVDLFGGVAAVDAWAVHPGGRSVLDRVEHGLGLDPDALADSRAVLREFGNMSSATILFVLQRMLEAEHPDGERLAVLAFGPGLTVEAARMTVRTAAGAVAPSRELAGSALR
ncbi:type III polyketide synthase [Arenivirga flava]|uniref:Naringenin-chalcone synthase n=1 Tax=Arenivirga flava TaxID=1930060 RepID=A0AA37UFX1_9MICO|nr:type III polyketide synthase [Arenivirga flava]GMA29559.1 naringenin-chalcone synthase [Arenivirga flava]